MYEISQLFTPPSEDFAKDVLIEDLTWERDVYLDGFARLITQGAFSQITKFSHSSKT